MCRGRGTYTTLVRGDIPVSTHVELRIGLDARPLWHIEEHIALSTTIKQLRVAASATLQGGPPLTCFGSTPYSCHVRLVTLSKMPPYFGDLGTATHVLPDCLPLL